MATMELPSVKIHLSERINRDCENYGRLDSDTFFLHEKVPESDFTAVDVSEGVGENLFVKTVIRAFCEHKGLHLRPDDFWLCALSQFSDIVNENVELFRDIFTDSLESKTVTISSYQDLSPDKVIEHFCKRVIDMIDPRFQGLFCDFTTSTPTTRAMSHIAFLESVKNYYKLKFVVLCGFPFIDLMGTREDWNKLVDKVSILKELTSGKLPELTNWFDKLRQLFASVLATYEDPASAESKNFWKEFVEVKNIEVDTIGDENDDDCGGDDSSNKSFHGWLVNLFYDGFNFKPTSDKQSFDLADAPEFIIKASYQHIEDDENPLDKILTGSPVALCESKEHGYMLMYGIRCSKMLVANDNFSDDDNDFF